MAQPIALHIAPRDPQHELNVRLQQAPQEHAEALLAGYEVLQAMHDKGVLEVMRGTLGGGDKILAQIVTMTREPESIRALRNLIVLAKAMGEVDPALVHDLTSAVPKALDQVNDREEQPPGFFKLLGNLRNKDFRRGLAVGIKLLTAFGKNLSARINTQR
jgi:uncharacterized protein YjgD (DUF1641 family)